MGFVPLTFGFESKDKSLGEGIRNINRSFLGMGTTMRGVGRMASAPLRMLGSAFSGLERRVGQFNLASIAQGMRDLTGQTGTLSDELDSSFASNAKAVKPMLAALGKSGKELRALTSKAAGMAYGMNVSADAVGKVMVAVESAGGPAKKGLDALNMSTQEFVKLSEVSGMDIQELGANLADLQTSWGMNAKQAASTTEAMLAYGQAAGIGSQGLMQMKPLLEKVNGLLADAPASMQLSSKEMQNLLISTTKLSGAYVTMGATQEEAMTAAQATTEMFVKQSVSFQKAMTGQGAEFEEMSKNLMPLLASMGISWEEFGTILREGAVDSTKGMMQLQGVVQRASASGFGPADVLMRKLLGSLGEASPAMAWLAQNVTQGEDALHKFNTMTVQSDGSIKKFANDGFSAGLTLQESFDRARQGMEHMVRQISGKEVGTYVKTQIKAFGIVGKEVQGLAKDPSWGGLVKKLSILKRAGVQGVLMSVAGDKKDQMEMGKAFAKFELLGGALDDVSKAAAPLMETLGKFGPLGTMVGGVAGWFMIPQTARDKILSDLEPLFQEVKTQASNIWYGTNGEAGLKTKLGNFFDNTVVPLFQEYAPKIGNFLWDGIKSVGSKLITEITNLLSGASGSQMATAFGATMLTSSFFTGGLTKAIVGAASLALGIALDEGKKKAEASASEKKAQQLAQTVGRSMIGPQGQQQSMATDEWWLDPSLIEMDQTEKTLKSKPKDLISKLQKNRELKKKGIDAWWYSEYNKRRTETGEPSQNDMLALESIRSLMETSLSRDKLAEGIGGDFLSPVLQAKQVYQRMRLWSMEKFLGKKIEDPTTMALSSLENAQNLPQVQERLSQLSKSKDLYQSSEDIQSIGKAFGGATKEQVSQALDLQMQASTQRFEAALQAIPGTWDDITSVVSTKSSEMAMIAQDSGTKAMQGLAESFMAQTPYLTEQVAAAYQVAFVDQTKANSPPATGPLSAAAGNPLYNGGIGMMDLLASGIIDGTASIEEAMKNALLSSFEAAWATYEENATQRITSSTVMAQVSKQLIEQLGGPARVELTPQEEKILKASLDVPGVTGIAGAIIADGNLTRKLLDRIAEATEGTFSALKEPGKGGRPVRLVTAQQ